MQRRLHGFSASLCRRRNENTGAFFPDNIIPIIYRVCKQQRRFSEALSEKSKNFLNFPKPKNLGYKTIGKYSILAMSLSGLPG